MNILSIFAYSPVRPIQHHMKKVHQCMAFFPLFLEAVYRQEWDVAKQKQQHIVALVKEADAIRHHVLLQLSTGFFKRLACSEIFELLREQNDIADSIKQVATLLVERKIEIPAVVTQNYYGFINACLTAVEKAKMVVDKLDTLLKSGGGASQSRLVQQVIIDLEHIETDVEAIHQQIKEDIFSLEQERGALEMGFLYKIFESTEKIASQTQQVGYRLQLLLVA